MERLALISRARQTARIATQASRAGGLLLLLFVVVGCASTGTVDPRETLQLALRGRGIDPSVVVVPFELNEEMRLWVHDSVPRNLSQTDKLHRLNATLLDPEQWNIEYTWGYTGTAAEVFEDRRANCLAFTNLFLGMAREAGVPVHFLAVERVETFRKEGDLVVVSDHVAVGYGDSHLDLEVFDFSEYRNDSYRDVRRVSDLTAIAMFHSNRGAEALQRGDVRDALEWLKTAVSIDPEMVHGWGQPGGGAAARGEPPRGGRCLQIRSRDRSSDGLGLPESSGIARPSRAEGRGPRLDSGHAEDADQESVLLFVAGRYQSAWWPFGGSEEILPSRGQSQSGQR